MLQLPAPAREQNNPDACTVAALDAITAFAVPNPNCPSQSRRFFQVWQSTGSPRLLDHPAYFGLAKVYFGPMQCFTRLSPGELGPPGDRRSTLCPSYHRSRTPPARDQFPDLRRRQMTSCPTSRHSPGGQFPGHPALAKRSASRSSGTRWTAGCPASQHLPDDRSPDPPTPARWPVSRPSRGPEVAFWVVRQT